MSKPIRILYVLPKEKAADMATHPSIKLKNSVFQLSI